MECPVCFSGALEVPIYQCANGHYTCNSCRKRLDKCPMCRDTAFNRNKICESLIQNSYKICEDCGEHVLFNDNQHTTTCPGQTRCCPFNCSWTGTRLQLLSHLISHGIRYIPNNEIELKISSIPFSIVFGKDPVLFRIEQIDDFICCFMCQNINNKKLDYITVRFGNDVLEVKTRLKKMNDPQIDDCFVLHRKMIEMAIFDSTLSMCLKIRD